MRWFTCTPVAFGGGADFFARDSGLMCRGFQIIGCESRAVMPGECKEEDDPDLIRTGYANLESVDWWKGHQLDGVILYAWGSPQYRKVAAAIHEAGIYLVLNQDNGGLISPLAGLRGWLMEQWIMSGRGKAHRSMAAYFKLLVRGLTIGLLHTDPLRASHLKNGDLIACVSPIAAEHYRKLCLAYGGRNLADRVTVLPHAVEPKFHFSGGSKRKQIACVGRWTDLVQKRPSLLMDVVGSLMTSDDRVEFVIAGNLTSEMEQWHRRLAEPLRNRVRLLGMVGRGKLIEIFGESRIFYSPSAFESFGIAAGEALCCGCSVVAGRSVSMAAFDWFVSEDAGTLANEDSVQGHVESIIAELANWENFERDPASISDIWCARLHADKVAERLLSMVQNRV